MAFWNRKRGKVYVHFWDNQEHRQKAISRTFTKHLDSQPDSNIDTWVNNYELTHEKPKRDINNVPKTKALAKLADNYCDFLISRGTRKPTVSGIRTYLTQVIAFFESIKALDPELWPNHTLDLWKHFQETKASSAVVRCSNVALRGFWKWLVLGQRVTNRPLALVSSVQRQKKTPLKFTLTPEEVLTYARSQEPLIAFLTLSGFFFSLRPQETFALTKADFVGGNRVATLECCKAMSELGMYSKLAVNIEKQLAREGIIDEAKSDSNGWAACFNEDAARMLVTLINNSEVEQICKWGNDYLGKLWSKKGIPGTTLKDLRRASIYWLGHHTSINIGVLKNHARHKKIETTALYMRRPEEELKAVGGMLSLD